MGSHCCCYFSAGLPGRYDSLPHGAMVLEPFQIAIARLKIEMVGNPFHGPGHLNGLGFHPAMPFAMAIGEADHPAPVVLRRREVIIEDAFLSDHESGVADIAGGHIEKG